MNTMYFKRNEFACRCNCGFDVVDVDLLEVLIDLRNHFDSPVYISSGCRCLEYNEIAQKETDENYIPYSSDSQHMIGKASDIKIKGYTPEQIYDYLNTKYHGRFGIGLYDTFIHVDVRVTKSRW